MNLAELYQKARQLGFTVTSVAFDPAFPNTDTVLSFTTAPATSSAELAQELLARVEAETVSDEATTTTERRDLVEVLTLELDDFTHRVARTTTEEAARAALTNTRTRMLEHFNRYVDHERRALACDLVWVDRTNHVVGYERAGRTFWLDGRPCVSPAAWGEGARGFPMAAG